MGDRTRENPRGTCERCGTALTVQDEGLSAHGYDRLCDRCWRKMRRAEEIALDEVGEFESTEED